MRPGCRSPGGRRPARAGLVAFGPQEPGCGGAPGTRPAGRLALGRPGSGRAHATPEGSFPALTEAGGRPGLREMASGLAAREAHAGGTPAGGAPTGRGGAWGCVPAGGRGRRGDLVLVRRQQPRRPRVGRHHLLTRSALPSPRSGRGVGSSRNFELGKFFSLKETRNLPTERPSSINGVCWVTFMSVLLNALELMPPRGASLENSFDQPSSFR